MPTATLTDKRSAAAPQKAPAKAPAKAKGQVLSINPMTRVGGALAVRAETDSSSITNAFVSGTQFRGYENILAGRDARDALAVSSRVCGWCGGVHMTTASMALEMAWGLQPPPMAIAMRAIAQCTEAIWVHAAHLAVRGGPDYCAEVMARTNPAIWQTAQHTLAPGAPIHGYKTIAELMEGLTPLTGRYWTETIPAGRRVQQMIAYLYGKFPHPSVITPGGLAQTLSIASFTEYFTQLYLSVDYVKQVLAMWDDLIDFLYEADPRFEHLGERPASFIHAGCWDDVRSLSSFASLDETGRRRLASPGVMLEGKMVTGSLTDVHQGIEEFVAHSFYQDWSGSGPDPMGGSIPAKHPWNKTTIPNPGTPSSTGAYSWATAPRWRNEVVESTPLGRLWFAATRDDFPANDFIEPTGKSLRILIPLNFYPEMVVEWKIPKRNNALERLRADAYGIAFAGLSAAISLLRGFELTRTGETGRSSSFKEPPQGPSAGVGLWESGRGMNVHWVSIDKGRLANYQVLGPSTWNASPRDGAGKPGPIEEALIGSPIIEEPLEGRISGVDVMRVVHSFDPCMHCGVA